MGNEIVMLGALALGGVVLWKSGIIDKLGGGGQEAQAAPEPAPAPEPAAPAAPADPYAGMQQQQQYPVGIPQPYPVGYPVGIPYDYIYLQDNLVGGYCHLDNRRVCWVGPSGLISCFNLNDHDWRNWRQDNNLRLRVCRNIRGRFISSHPMNRFPKNQHHTPHRTNQDHRCGNDNHWENNHCTPNHPGGPPGHGGPPGGHGGPPGGDDDHDHGGPGPIGGGHGGPPPGGDHTCPSHKHWDGHSCVEDISPPPGGGPGGQGHGPNTPMNPGGPPAQAHYAVSI